MPSMRIFVALPNLVLLVGFLGLGCSGLPSRVPLHDDLGSYGRKVGTRSEEAQRYFDQGLVLTHAFNYEEAYRSYEEAARQDPRCAMAWWGMALVSGPHINNPGMQEEDSRRAYDASRKALELAASATPVERALIEALVKRYAWPAPEDRKPLDQAWAEAMREVHGRFPLDPEVVAARVESLLMLRPWDLWMPDGRPQPGTEEVIAILEDGLRRWPEHPYLNHA